MRNRIGTHGAGGRESDPAASFRAFGVVPDHRFHTTDILREWQSLKADPGLATPKELVRLAESAVAAGEPLVAYDVAVRGLEILRAAKLRRETPSWQQASIRLSQLLALALSRSGSVAEAAQVLRGLMAQGVRDGETLALLGRTVKDSALAAPNRSGRIALFKKAARHYRAALRVALRSHNLDCAYYAGINAATLMLFQGDARTAKRLASQTTEACERRLRRSNRRGADRYWALATLAEAELVFGRFDSAAELYALASREGVGRFADLASTRRHARLILEHYNQPSSALDDCFPIPSVAVFSGRMFVRRDRQRPTPFTAEHELRVQHGLSLVLRNRNVGIGFSSAACGSDIVFAEAMLRRGAEVHVVLPIPAADYRSLSVEPNGMRGWGRRFDAVLRRATRVVCTGTARLAELDVEHDFCNRVADGLATLRSRMLDTERICIAAWDGTQDEGTVGTHRRMQLWKERGWPVEIVPVSPTGAGNPTRTTRSLKPPPLRAGRKGERALRRLLAMIFADVVNYSRFAESEYPVFSHAFFGAIRRSLAAHSRRVLSRRTSGDGVFLVIDGIRDAGRLALSLRDALRNARHGQSDEGLPTRISLHAGPVYEVVDAVSGNREFVGSHVNLAARMEPITPPGRVFASEAFAALAACEGIPDFAFDYVGQLPLAKGYGVFPMYHLRWSGGYGTEPQQ